MEDTSSRLEAALRIAAIAGKITLEYFQRDNFDVERKADNSPVTQADRAAERRMREEIAREFPQDGIVGEEFGEQQGTSAYRWILDPIDGTKSFICGVPLYSVLIGILRDEESVAGVIHVPALQETVSAARGKGALWQVGDRTPRPASVSTRPLSAGVFLTSQVDTFAERDAADAYKQLEGAADITRSWGDAYGYLLIATGRAEAMVDPIMNVWDAAPLLPILAEAGGAFTDWSGEPTVHHGEGVGSNLRAQAEVLEITGRFRRPS